MIRVKVNLSIGYPGAGHDDELEFDEGMTDEQIDREVAEWANNYIEYYWERITPETKRKRQ